MTRLLLLSLFLFAGSFAIAQDEGEGTEKKNDTWTDPVITDDMTLDSEKNALWRTGDYAYSAKPKDGLELGIDVGHAYISGDVDRNFPFGGYQIGIHMRKAFNYTFSWKVSGNYNYVKGLDARKLNYQTFKAERVENQNIDKFSAYQGSNLIHRNYETTLFNGDVQGVISIGNLLFHQERNKWNLYLGAGMGLYSLKVNSNLLDGDQTYNFSTISGDFTTREGRRDLRNDVKNLLDDSYETEVPLRSGVISLTDDTSLRAYATFSASLNRKISKRFNIGLEHQVYISDQDLMDGYEFRTGGDRSNDKDVLHNTRVSFNFNLGNFNKKTEPLYWLNPIAGSYNDIAALKQRPVVSFDDADGDGILDMLDEEPDTPEGCPVNSHGVAVDSDSDGYLDCDDWEPYTPPGLEVDEHGVGIVPEEVEELAEDAINDMIDRKLAGIRTSWFLPMIHFDLDKYRIKPEFYGQLHHVAEVMNQHPGLRVVVRGYADNRKDNSYNDVLSYERAEAAVNYLTGRYGIDRSRFILQYAGENDPLVSGIPDNHSISKREEFEQYMNRRVEFVVSNGSEVEMGRPAGSAGSNTPGSSRGGSKYSGNRNSGYE